MVHIRARARMRGTAAPSEWMRAACTATTQRSAAGLAAAAVVLLNRCVVRHFDGVRDDGLRLSGGLLSESGLRDHLKRLSTSELGEEGRRESAGWWGMCVCV
jgi:hypothetical protein